MIRLKKSVKIRKNKGNFILFDTKKELLHEVNEIGYEIIKTLKEKREKEEIQRILSSKFENIKPERIKKDINKFIANLEKKGLLKILPSKVTDKVFLFKSEIGAFTYYIKDEDKKILIDAGVFVKKPIDLIIITHCHFDHILFLNELKKCNDCKVICGVKDEEAIEKLTNKTLLEKAPKKIIPTKIKETVKEGDIIKTKDFSFKVLETPGHTNGSISLFGEKKRILFSGDSWFGENEQGRHSYPSGSKTESKKTLKKLKSLDVKILCPGHWGVIHN